tara:strand:- start:209 stop:403 length:195 start_codon:yes stop_codon:yes gene_type:complete
MTSNVDFVLADLEQYLRFLMGESGAMPDLELACDYLEMQEVELDYMTISMASEIVQSIIGAEFQ